MYPGLLRKYFAVDSFCHLVKVSICTCIYNFITLQGFLVRRVIFVEIISRIIGGFKKFQKILILGNLKPTYELDLCSAKLTLQTK